MANSAHAGKIVAGIMIAVVVIFASQWYPKYTFAKYTGFKLPALSAAVKWSSDQRDFFAVFLTTPGSAKKFVNRPYLGKEWRNDTLKVRLNKTSRNVPFFDLAGNELTHPDNERWFHTNIRQLDPRGYLQKGYAVIVYPDKGLIYISAGE